MAREFRLISITGLLTLSGLVAGLVAGPVLGAESEAPSSITSVTVFPAGAEVTRSVPVELSGGEQTVNVLVPGEVDSNSLRVSSDSAHDVRIGSVDARDVEDQSARLAIEKEMQTLSDERATLDRAVADSNFSRNLLVTLAQRRLQPQGDQTSPLVPPPEELSALLNMVDQRLTQISKLTLDAGVRRREIDRQVEGLKQRLASATQNPPRQSQVSIHVLATKPAKAVLIVSYRTTAASWRPIYDARLETGEGGKPPHLTLVRNAAVVQETAEPWKDVELFLSTASPTGATMPPDLRSQEIRSFAEVSNQPETAEGSQAGGGASADAGGVAKTGGTTSTESFQAVYEIPGRVTVENTNTPKLVTIASDSLEASLSLKAVPKLDLSAYLLVRSASTAPTALLPGPVMLFRDGVFVGESKLPMILPGQGFELGFGADEFVSLERRETSHKAGETGLISSALVDERSYLTTIVSRHAMPVRMTVVDQVPYATDDRIRVELLPDALPPTSKDVDGRKGVYAWTFDLKPGGRTDLPFGFRVIWPKDVR